MAQATPLDAAIASMNRQGRQAVGNSTYNTKLDARKPSSSTILEPRKNTQSGDLSGPTGHRKGELYPGPAGRGDRDGAAFRITAQMPVAESPEASQTQRNVKTVGSAINRSTPAFNGGSRSGY